MEHMENEKEGDELAVMAVLTTQMESLSTNQRQRVLQWAKQRWIDGPMADSLIKLLGKMDREMEKKENAQRVDAKVDDVTRQ